MLETLLPGLAGIHNIHPLTVHFPIALLTVALALQAAVVLGRREAWAGHARVCLYLGTVGALAAVGAGLLAAESLGHDSPGHDLVHIHRNFMFATTLLAMGTSLASLRMAAQPRQRNRVVLLGLLVTWGVLTLGADRGANLVFRYGISVANEPVPAGGEEHGDGHDHGHAEPAESAEPAPAPEPEPGAHEHGDHAH